MTPFAMNPLGMGSDQEQGAGWLAAVRAHMRQRALSPTRVAMSPLLQGQTPPTEQAPPEDWWRHVPPDQQDWWTRFLNNRGPNANPQTFNEGGTLHWPGELQRFNDEGIMSYNQPVTQEWMRQWSTDPRMRSWR